MAVFRVEKTKDFTVMSNHHLRNVSLSLKAKGLLSLMLSFPYNLMFCLPIMSAWQNQNRTVLLLGPLKTSCRSWPPAK